MARDAPGLDQFAEGRHDRDLVRIKVDLPGQHLVRIQVREGHDLHPHRFVETGPGHEDVELVAVRHNALARALQAGHLCAAALDVHAAEPADPASPLRGIENLLLTPHVAGGSRQVVLREMSALCDNFVDTLQGLPPRHGRVAA